MSKEYEKTQNTKYLKWVPLLTYNISKNLTKKETQQDAFQWCENLKISKDKAKGGDNLPYLKTIVEYVLTYTRGGD
jgi:CRISPR-associated protein Csm1